MRGNLIYFGSPDFSATILESILPAGTDPGGRYKVVGVVTTPDKPTGRHGTLTPSPVALSAQKHDLPVFKPEKLDEASLAHLKLLKPDLFLIVSYGKIIPASWLSLPKTAALNLHFSLLPRHRGALCRQEALKDGDVETGVTLMVMDEQMDHGPVISQAVQPIDINDNIETLTQKLTQKAIALLQKNLPLYLTDQIKPVPQDETKATYTPSYKTVTRETAFTPWSKIQEAQSGRGALDLHNLIRSLNPEPGAWTRIGNLEPKILKTELKADNLELITVQLPGKSPVSWKQFFNGYLASSSR